MQILTDEAKVGALAGIVLCPAAKGAARVPVACACCSGTGLTKPRSTSKVFILGLVSRLLV